MVLFGPCSPMHELDCIHNKRTPDTICDIWGDCMFLHASLRHYPGQHIVHIMHFYLLINNYRVLSLLPKLCSTVCHVEQSKILEITRPTLRTWVVSGHVQWQTESLGKGGKKRMACISVSCCCHMWGIRVGWQLSWSLDGNMLCFLFTTGLSRPCLF